MEEISVKQEFHIDNIIVCRTCLSIGRRLFPLEQLKNTFRILTSEFMYATNISLDLLQLCWECIATLKKVLQFQMRVKKANDLLNLNEDYTNVCLSTLKTQTLKYTQTIHIKEKIKQTDNGKINETLEKNVLINSDQIQNDLNFDKDNLDIKKEVKFNNKWVKKRALENKTPKFKMILADEGMFRRVKLAINEAYNYLEREKENKNYKSKGYKCEDCVIGFNKKNSLLKHKKNYHHNTGQYVCDLCKVKFISKRHLTKHLINHYDVYECILCGQSFRDEIQKGIHLRKHGKILQCSKCELKFCNRRDFFKHYKEWHEKFICDHCGISFKMRYCIKDHIRKQHSPFQCKPCNKTFGRYNGLWLHNKLRHSPLGQPAYCVECDRHYVDVYRYKWHLANSAKHKPRQRVRIS